MNKFFEEALVRGHLVPAKLPNGDFLELPDHNGSLIRYYIAGEDSVSLYALRFMAIADLSRMHTELKLNPDYLKANGAAVSDLINTALMCVQSDPKKAVDALSDVKTLHARFMERSSLGMDLEHFYDIVSAMLFTEDEDPRTLDQTHCSRKKAHLARFPELYDFFLAQRLSRFVPWQVLFNENTRNLARDQSIQEVYDLTLLSLKYGSSGLAPDTDSTIRLRRETLRNWIGLLGVVSRNTANTLPTG